MNPREIYEAAQTDQSLMGRLHKICAAGMGIFVCHQDWSNEAQASKWHTALLRYISDQIVQSRYGTEAVRQAQIAPGWVQIWIGDEQVPRLG